MLRRYDVNAKDGTLDLFEFDRLFRDLNTFQSGGTPVGGKGGGLGGGIDAHVSEAFARFDADGNGTIDARELREALHHLDMSATAQQTR